MRDKTNQFRIPRHEPRVFYRSRQSTDSTLLRMVDTERFSIRSPLEHESSDILALDSVVALCRGTRLSLAGHDAFRR